MQCAFITCPCKPQQSRWKINREHVQPCKMNHVRVWSQGRTELAAVSQSPQPSQSPQSSQSPQLHRRFLHITLTCWYWCFLSHILVRYSMGVWVCEWEVQTSLAYSSTAETDLTAQRVTGHNGEKRVGFTKWKSRAQHEATANDLCVCPYPRDNVTCGNTNLTSSEGKKMPCSADNPDLSQ